MTKTLLIINEPLSEMFLGKNTSLAYALSCAELGHEVFIFDLTQSPKIVNQTDLKTLPVSKLEDWQTTILAEKFRQENLKIRTLHQNSKYAQLADLPNVKVSEVIAGDFHANFSLAIADIDLVIQRLEPMKSPFPPQGHESVRNVMIWLKNLFPSKIFNCPINDQLLELEDKETLQQINRIYRKEIATPTFEFSLRDVNKTAAINFAAEKYSEIFGDKNAAKIVIKPKNSAQSLGVFALQFEEFGFDLKTIKSKKVSELSNVQIYKIQPQNLEEIIAILCFVQRVKDDQNYATRFIGDIAQSEILSKAEELYNQQILAQPFLEGIAAGDIRANILKDSHNNFYCVGYTFRSNNRQIISDDFTTCYTSGKAISKPISFLTNHEQNALISQCQIVLKILNNELRENYKNVVELGADFILVGDQKSIMLGEINHHCPALLPISEAMSDINYDGGLAFTKQAVLDLINR